MITYVSPIVALLGLVLSIWWRIENKIGAAKTEASTVASAANALAGQTRQELADHKLHVAETYITKAGMRDVKDEILGAVSGIKDDLGRLNERIDRMHEAQASKPRSSRA
jgi:ubiquinone biosynthesis protein UbiJ